MAKKYDSLAHTKYYTRYHIVFTPKYRRKVIYNQLRKDIAGYFKKLCKYKGVEIIEGHMMVDHVHILVSIPPKMSVSSFMGYLKGKSAMMIFEYHANLKYKYGNRHFWADEGKDDIAKDKLSVKEYEDPFGEDKVIRKANKDKQVVNDR